MRVLAGFIASAAIVLGIAPGVAADSFEGLSARADLVVLGQVLQTGEMDGEPVATIAIDRQLSGIEAAGALTFSGPEVTGWRVGERSVYFLRRRSAPGDGPRFIAIAAPGESLLASADILRNAPVRSASLRREPAEPLQGEGGVSLTAAVAGLLAAGGILALARLKRRLDRGRR